MPLKQKHYHGLLLDFATIANMSLSKAKQTWYKQTIMISDNSNLSIVPNSTKKWPYNNNFTYHLTYKG
jgi:hypothetical protein